MLRGETIDFVQLSKKCVIVCARCVGIEFTQMALHIKWHMSDRLGAAFYITGIKRCLTGRHSRLQCYYHYAITCAEHKCQLSINMTE